MYLRFKNSPDFNKSCEKRRKKIPGKKILRGNIFVRVQAFLTKLIKKERKLDAFIIDPV